MRNRHFSVCFLLELLASKQTSNEVLHEGRVPEYSVPYRLSINYLGMRSILGGKEDSLEYIHRAGINGLCSLLFPSNQRDVVNSEFFMEKVIYFNFIYTDN